MAVGAKGPNTYTDTTITNMLTSAPFSGERREQSNTRKGRVRPYSIPSFAKYENCLYRRIR